MVYEIILRKRDKIVWHQESLLPFMYNEALIDGMRAEFLDKEGYCKACDVKGSRCHVMIPDRDGDPDTWEKLCPVMFHDVFKPKWKIKDII
jgi:hypothetical protein